MQVQHEDLAVPDGTGTGSLGDSLDGRFDILIIHRHFQLHFFQKTAGFFMAAIHLGNALLAAAQAWAEGRSHRRLILEMQSKNLPAIRLAQKFGCEFCGYNDHYYLTQDVTLFFTKTLK